MADPNAQESYEIEARRQAYMRDAGATHTATANSPESSYGLADKYVETAWVSDESSPLAADTREPDASPATQPEGAVSYSATMPAAPKPEERPWVVEEELEKPHQAVSYPATMETP